MIELNHMTEAFGSIPQSETVHLHVAKDDAGNLRDQLVVKGIDSKGAMHGQVVNPTAEKEKIISIEMPEAMSKRLTYFFDRFLVDPDPKDWVNCHRFAVWMTTGKMPEDPSYPQGQHASDHPAVIEIAEQGIKTKGPLAMGQHAVVVETGWTGKKILPPDHSVIGLGPTDDEALQCIQINNLDGDMTLSSATRYIDEKNRLGVRGQRDLYTLADH